MNKKPIGTILKLIPALAIVTAEAALAAGDSSEILHDGEFNFLKVQHEEAWNQQDTRA